MVTFLFVATLAILEFLWSAARGESSRQERAGLQILLSGGTMFDRIAFVVKEKIQSKEKDKNADAPNSCVATLIARADSSELTSESLIEGRLMVVAHCAISIHVGSSVLKQNLADLVC